MVDRFDQSRAGGEIGTLAVDEAGPGLVGASQLRLYRGRLVSDGDLSLVWEALARL